MEKIMISVAPVANTDTNINPLKIAEDVYESYKNGASMVHLHVRDEHGKLTSDMTLLNEIVSRIREKCDIVIEISTGGVSNLTIEERCQPCYSPLVEATSLNVGSVNLGEKVYQNPIKDVKYCVKQILDNDKRPEIEVFELGMIHTAHELAKEFKFVEPILFALVCGNEGAMPATETALDHMIQYLKETFGNDSEILWGYTEANRKDWKMMECALNKGAHSIRVGFEDSDHISPQIKVATNAELIKAAADLVRKVGKEPMTSAEVRKMLKLK